MGVFRLISSVSGNRPPEVRGYTLFLSNRTNAVLTVNMFTSGYDDLDNDSAQSIILESLPSTSGRFFYNGTALTAAQEISISDIQAGLLTFEAPDQDSQFTDDFQFKVSDGEENSNIVTFTVIVGKVIEEINNPPSVGNNSFDLDYNQEKNFTLTEFTTETTPVYYDPEGDLALNIKISQLPNRGKLFLNSVEVAEGQIISVNDIEDLSYKGDINTIISNQNRFRFQIEDTGSGQYSNEGIITLNIDELVVTPPTVDDNSAPLTDLEYIFKLTDLTNNFQDIDGDSYSEFVIKILTDVGQLYYNNTLINPDTVINPADIANFRLILSNAYAVYNNILYKFEKSIDDIITDFEDDGYKLIENEEGTLVFKSMTNADDIQTVTSEEITNDKLQLDFLVKDDSILQLESNIATFSLIPEGDVNTKPIYTNEPPTVDDNLDYLNSTTYQYKLDDFINNFADPDNDSYLDLIIKSLPAVGRIKVNGANISTEQRFPVTDASELIYYLPNNYMINNNILYEFSKNPSDIILDYEDNSYILSEVNNGNLIFAKVGEEYNTRTVAGTEIPNSSLCFDFQVTDDSLEKLKSNTAEFCLITQGNINKPQPYINQPPTVTDFVVSTKYNTDYVFSLQEFLNVYNDIEGDDAKEIIITSLPNNGTLNINIGQPFSVDNFNIIFDPDQNIEEEHSVTFEFQMSDEGSDFFSNTGIVSINVGEKLANAPTVDDSTFTISQKITSLTTGLFTNNFSDADGDSYETVRITSLPKEGILRELTTDINIGHELSGTNSSKLKFVFSDNYAIYDGDIYKFRDNLSTIISDNQSAGYELTNNSNGVLTFTKLEDENDSFTETGTLINNSDLCFNFRISDDSELTLFSNNAEICPFTNGDINVKPVYSNDPPIVGDNTVSTHYNKAYEFVRSSFIEDTDPRFSDPEGDAPFKLKILSLPQNGQLLYEGQSVSINDEFFFENGVDEGKLIYVPDSSRIDINGTMFRFAVSDTGSKIFVE